MVLWGQQRLTGWGHAIWCPPSCNLFGAPWKKAFWNLYHVNLSYAIYVIADQISSHLQTWIVFPNGIVFSISFWTQLWWIAEQKMSYIWIHRMSRKVLLIKICVVLYIVLNIDRLTFQTKIFHKVYLLLVTFLTFYKLNRSPELIIDIDFACLLLSIATLNLAAIFATDTPLFQT